MRFLLKCAFWLGLVAFLLPFGEHRSGAEAEISWLGAFAGVQEALDDLGGFCGRAPRACEAGREVALFASERVGDGIAIAYGFIESHGAPAAALPRTVGHQALGPEGSPDPLMTGGVAADAAAPPLPRAYTAPKRMPAADSAPARATAIPTPAPRS